MEKTAKLFYIGVYQQIQIKAVGRGTVSEPLRQASVLCLDNLKENGWSKIQPFLLVVDKIGLVGYNSFEDITSFNCQSITCDGIGGIVESWGA